MCISVTSALTSLPTLILFRHYTNKYTTLPRFINEICKALAVGNIRRSSINFAQIVADMAIPENSYVLLDVVVKTSPEVFPSFFFSLLLLLTFHEGVLLYTSWWMHGVCRKSKGTSRVSHFLHFNYFFFFYGRRFVSFLFFCLN